MKRAREPVSVPVPRFERVAPIWWCHEYKCLVEPCRVIRVCLEGRAPFVTRYQSIEKEEGGGGNAAKSAYSTQEVENRAAVAEKTGRGRGSLEKCSASCQWPALIKASLQWDPLYRRQFSLRSANETITNLYLPLSTLLGIAEFLVTVGSDQVDDCQGSVFYIVGDYADEWRRVIAYAAKYGHGGSASSSSIFHISSLSFLSSHALAIPPPTPTPQPQPPPPQQPADAFSPCGFIEAGNLNGNKWTMATVSNELKWFELKWFPRQRQNELDSRRPVLTTDSNIYERAHRAVILDMGMKCPCSDSHLYIVEAAASTLELLAIDTANAPKPPQFLQPLLSSGSSVRLYIERGLARLLDLVAMSLLPPLAKIVIQYAGWRR